MGAAKPLHIFMLLLPYLLETLIAIPVMTDKTFQYRPGWRGALIALTIFQVLIAPLTLPCLCQLDLCGHDMRTVELPWSLIGMLIAEEAVTHLFLLFAGAVTFNHYTPPLATAIGLTCAFGSLISMGYRAFYVDEIQRKNSRHHQEYLRNLRTYAGLVPLPRGSQLGGASISGPQGEEASNPPSTSTSPPPPLPTSSPPPLETEPSASLTMLMRGAELHRDHLRHGRGRRQQQAGFQAPLAMPEFAGEPQPRRGRRAERGSFNVDPDVISMRRQPEDFGRILSVHLPPLPGSRSTNNLPTSNDLPPAYESPPAYSECFF